MTKEYRLKTTFLVQFILGIPEKFNTFRNTNKVGSKQNDFFFGILVILRGLPEKFVYKGEMFKNFSAKFNHPILVRWDGGKIFEGMSLD